MRGEALSAEANRVLRRPEFRDGPSSEADRGPGRAVVSDDALRKK